ncbi:hypothetical protein L484_014743 [Morus notabilis]|uniref:Uncharacterized protein n=1 Tax=Morus notabilis TaxID=981085 RepID=W9QEL5_9ROSA|nr:hypothetical protein L484_014743 [Morus notabilis]
MTPPVYWQTFSLSSSPSINQSTISLSFIGSAVYSLTFHSREFSLPVEEDSPEGSTVSGRVMPHKRH